MGQVVITTNIQLDAMMKDILEKVFEKVSDSVLKKFQIEYLKKIAYRGYENYSGNSVYKNDSPDNSFFNSWEWSEIKFSANEITRTMWYNWQKMNMDSNAFGTNIGIHSSLVKGWDVDERSYLAETLNKSAPSSSLPMSVPRPGAYWDDFIRDYVTSNKLKQEFDKAFADFGIRAG